MIRTFVALILFSSLLISSEMGECVVAIDVGHTIEEQGVKSARGVSEYKFNRRAANELFDKLKMVKNLTPVIINEDGENIPIVKRIMDAKDADADIFISFHQAKVQDRFLLEWKDEVGKEQKFCDRFSGYTTFISPKNKNFLFSLELGEEIGKALNAKGFRPSLYHSFDINGERRKAYSKELGVFRYDNKTVLKDASMPAVEIEEGFIQNREEELELNDPDRRSEFLNGVARGIVIWCLNNKEI